MPFARAFLISSYKEGFCLGDACPQMADTLIGLFRLLRAQTVLLVDRFFLYKWGCGHFLGLLVYNIHEISSSNVKRKESRQLKQEEYVSEGYLLFALMIIHIAQHDGLMARCQQGKPESN